ncbi:hypothetical protein GCM10018987_18880 [Streptomyces cremeus]
MGAAGPAVLGERVEVGVRGDVRGVPAAAPHAGGGGVQHERVELVVVQEFVQVPGAADLGVDDLGERLGAGLGEGGQFDDGGGVHDVAHRAPLGGQARQEGGDGPRGR